MAKNGQNWPQNDQIWCDCQKKWLILIYFTDLKPFWSHKVGCATFLQWGGLNGPKFWFCRREKFLMGGQAQTFSTSYMTQKLFYIAFSGNLGNMFLRKIHFCVHPFEPKKAIFDLLRGCFRPKTWKKIVFSVYTIQNFRFWNPNVSPQKVENFGPTDPPWPPPTPPDTPQGSGGAKNGQNAFPQVHWW